MHTVKLRILYASLVLVLLGGGVLALGIGSYRSSHVAQAASAGTASDFPQLVGTLQQVMAASPNGFSPTTNQDPPVAEPIRRHRERDNSGWGDD